MEEDFLQYGDIIHITSQINHSLHDKTFLVDFIDNKIIRVINTTEQHIIQIEDDGTFRDPAIVEVAKISSALSKGFCAQNNLNISKWVLISFNRDFPDVTGIITNVEQDRIEVKLMEGDKDIIYIDFEYKGLPEFIKSIIVSDVPENFSKGDDMQEIFSALKLDLQPIVIDDELKHLYETEEINKELKTMYLSTDDIIFSDNVERVVLRIEKDERFKKHSIEAQITDIIDTLLSTIPNHQRNDSVLNEVHHIVERYTQLINNFSKRDEFGTVVCPSLYGKNNKPIASCLTDANFKKPKWVLPVISPQRKLYTTPQAQDLESVLEQENAILENIQKSLETQYEQQRRYYRGTNTKYGYVEHVNDTSELMIPYINNEDTSICNQSANTDQEALILETTSWSKSNMWSETYNMTQMINTGDKYTTNEIMNIKSIVLLPEVISEISKISLNNLNIMTRSSMNKCYVSLFNILHNSPKKDSLIRKRTVDKYEEINYESNRVSKLCYMDRPRVKHMTDTEVAEQKQKRMDEKFNNSNFSKHTTNYVIDTTSTITEDDDLYAKFLYTIFPSTYELLKTSSTEKQMTKNYSFCEFVNKFLEPYMIYTKNIHFDEGYAFIRFAIKKAIEEYKVKVLVDGKKSRRKILELKKKNVVVYKKQLVEEIIESNIEVYNKSYIGNEPVMMTQFSSSELLANIFNVDGANMMSNIIFSKNKHLVVNPEFVDDVIETNSNENEKCSKSFITKRYTSDTDLSKDNGNDELFYDTEFDDTPYKILNMYKKEQQSNNKFEQFLKRILIEKHSCPVSASSELAETLIRGRKLVTEGEYAVLVIEGRQIFYKRKSNKWVLDRSVKPSFFINNNELFCNINDKCIKNDKTKSCDGITEHRNIYITEFNKRLTELDNRLQIDNEKNLESLYGFIKRNNMIKYIQSHRQNILSVELSKNVTIDNKQKSPYTSLRDNILAHQNFPEKQDFIALFSEQYTRKPIISEPENESESPYWLYCKKTNTKLLPQFLLQLSNAFKSGTYEDTLSKICCDFGDPDSHGTYFDKNSGYSISKMDLVTLDEYSEGGSIISSHSIIEKDVDEDGNSNFFHKSTNIIDTIFLAICSKLDIRYKENEFHSFIMKKTTEMVDKIEDEETYIRKLEIMKKKVKKITPLPYDVFVNQNIIYIVSSLIFILIQTSIPPIKRVKTFEECVQSFGGFPMTSSDEDESGIKYIACVVLKLKNSTTPWNGIMNINENIFKENLKRKLIGLLLRKDIKELYEKKKIYNIDSKLTNKETKQSNIVKWVNVLPPIVQFTVKKQLSNITNEFHNELMKLIRTGHKDQHKLVGIIRSKIISYGYAIIESINDIVKSKESTLKTSSNVPYKQNSCCNERHDHMLSALQYFNNEDNGISNIINNSLKCELILSDIRELSTASLFFYEPETRNKVSNDSTISLQYRDNVISTFIYYLKYDTNLPVPFIFKDKYVKPSKYDSMLSFDEKINILESDKSNYDINALDNLLKIVNSKNKFNADYIVNNSYVYDENDSFKQFIDLRLNNVVINDIIPETVTDIIYQFSTMNVDQFKIHIGNVNENIKEHILQDVVNLLNYNQRDFESWSSNLTGMTNTASWAIFNEDNITHKNTVLLFVQNAISKMCKVYPSFIRNNVTEHMEIKKRWGLSEKHLLDLSSFKDKNLFKYLNKFNSVDDGILFTGNLQELDDIILLANNLPHSKDFDSYISETLLTYCWLSVFKVFIQSTSELTNTDYLDGDKNFYKRRMVQLLTSFLEMETNNKRFLDISLKQIQHNSFKYRQVEKKMITDTLKELNSDGRKLMSQMKKIGLGIWREGKIGLVKYDPKAYDRNGIRNDESETETADDEEFDEQPSNDADTEETGYDFGDGDGNNDYDDIE
jgi:hypothetical protein